MLVWSNATLFRKWWFRCELSFWREIRLKQYHIRYSETLSRSLLQPQWCSNPCIAILSKEYPWSNVIFRGIRITWSRMEHESDGRDYRRERDERTMGCHGYYHGTCYRNEE